MPSMNFPTSPLNGGPGPPPQRSPWSRRIPWGTLAVLAASGAFLAFFYHIPPSSTDEGMIAAGAERILRGQIPYRDFFTELGPGSFYLQVGIFQLFGISVSSIRLTAWILGALLSGLVFVVGRKIIRGPAAIIPPFIFATTCYPFAYFVNHHWWGNLFFLLNLVCLATFARSSNAGALLRSRALLLGAGLLATLTLLCMQPKGAWAIIVGVAYLFLAEQLSEGGNWFSALRESLAWNFWLLVGFGTSLGLVAAYFWAHGALGAWVYDNFTFLFTNYLPYEKWPGMYSLTRLIHILRWVAEDFSLLSVSYFVGFYFYAVVGPAIGFLGALAGIKRERDSDPLRSRMYLLLLLAGIGSLISELHEPNILHLIWASPLIVILFVSSWYDSIRRRGPWRRPLIATAALILVSVVVVAERRVARVAMRNTPVQTRRGTIYLAAATASLHQKWIDAIQRAVPAGGETFIFPYDAQFYFLTATRTSTRYDVLVRDFHSPAQFDEVITSLQKQPPRYVFSFDLLARWSPRAQYPDDPPDFMGPDLMEKSLQATQSQYQKAETVAGMEVWALTK